MDGARVIYDNVAYLVVFPLLGGVLAPIIGVLVYRYSRRKSRKHETSKGRAYLFYRVLTGVLFGQYICHVTIVAPTNFALVGFKYLFLFMAAGYVLMDVAETVGRCWNTNSHSIGPIDGQVSDDIALNKEKMEENTVIVAQDISSNDFATVVWMAEDYAKDKRKRLWLLGLLFVIFGIIALLDGFLLIYRNPQSTGLCVGITVCYFVNGISMTIAIYGAMIHAKIHIIQERRPRLFWSGFLGGLWCVILVCSAVPVLASTPLSIVKDIVESNGFIAFYGLAMGCVIRLQQYFYNMKLEHTTVKEQALGESVFILAVAQSAVTGLWL
jgi:hypothetical protein